jgi:hypothetical protein
VFKYIAPLATVGDTEPHTKLLPFQTTAVPAVVGAAKNVVVFGAVWYGIWFAAPPARFDTVPLNAVVCIVVSGNCTPVETSAVVIN